jgi:hypothetical protein
MGAQQDVDGFLIGEASLKVSYLLIFNVFQYKTYYVLEISSSWCNRTYLNKYHLKNKKTMQRIEAHM